MKSQANVLIVDDELGARESLRQVLKNTYNVALAINGKDALVKLYRDEYDLITLDLRMPEMDGITTLKAIKTYNPNVEVIVVTGFGTLDTAKEAIRYGAFDYISKPFDVEEVNRVVKKSIRRHRMNVELKGLFKELGMAEGPVTQNTEGEIQEIEVINKARTFIQNYVQRTDGNEEGDYLDFIKVLSRTLETKDTCTHGHSDRVNYYTRLICNKMNITSELRLDLQRASFLHDIGKLGINNDILLRRGALNPEEWKIIRKHPEEGAHILEPMFGSGEVIRIVLHHHENYDGTGYPFGLKGEDIPLGARIINIVDSYDAMTSHRPYSKAKTRKEAIMELKRCSGTQFDPNAAAVFIEILLEEEEGDNNSDKRRMINE
ncbi:MAG: response regulator [bacterium]|nr:response regulator [bacterium]